MFSVGFGVASVYFAIQCLTVMGQSSEHKELYSQKWRAGRAVKEGRGAGPGGKSRGGGRRNETFLSKAENC